MDVTTEHFVQVNLQNKVDIAKTLSRVVSTSFGPSCLQTMLTTSTGAVLVTSQGIAILKSLQMSHPLARVIVDAASTHHRNIGDATKTLILLLEHSLLAVQDIISKQSGSHLGSMKLRHQMDNYLSNKIAISLGIFSNTVLPEVFMEAQEKADVLDADCCIQILKEKMSAVLTTTLSSHLSSALSKVFVSLVMDSIISRTELQSLESLKQRIQFILDNFEFMHVKSPGHTYRESSSVSGFLLQRNFSYLSDNLTKKKIRCVLLRCPMEGISSDDKATFRLKSDESLKAAVTHRLNNAKIFLQTLRSHGITLIISTEKVPEYVLSLCRQFDISVICYLEEEDIIFVEKITGKFSIHSTWDLVDNSVIIDVSECHKIPIGSQIFVQLNIDKELPKQLILCAPTESMCHQLADIVYKGFKSLFFCFQKSHVVHQDDDTCNTCTRMADKNVTLSSVRVSNETVGDLLGTSSHIFEKNNTVTDSSNRVRPVEINGISLDNGVMMRNEISLDDGAMMRNEISLDDGSLRNEISLDDGSLRNEISLDNRLEIENKMSLDATVKSTGFVSDDSIKVNNNQSSFAFVMFPGGGYFEYLIAYLLDRRMESCINVETSWCCQILAKSLRTIPFKIHKNLSHNADLRSFLNKDKQIHASLKNNHTAGFNCRGQVCDPFKEGILEPPFAKFAVIHNVIHLLQQLLKVDGIVGVKTMQTKAADTLSKV